MDDLISKQAAIDALGKIPVHEFKKTDGLLDALVSIGDVYMTLKQLPSAQPEVLAYGEGVLNTQHDNDRIWEALSKVYNMDGVPDEAKAIIGDVMLGLDEPHAQPEIVRCKDCKYYDQNDHCFLQGAEPEDYCSYAERRTDG